mgnify:CR=1 FL=1
MTLKSSDGESFEVDESVAMESQTIKHIIEDGCANNEIPLPNVTSGILSRVIEYCKKHKEAAGESEPSVTPYTSNSTTDPLAEWDTEFVKVDQNTLFDLILVRTTPFVPFSKYPFGDSFCFILLLSLIVCVVILFFWFVNSLIFF